MYYRARISKLKLCCEGEKAGGYGVWSLVGFFLRQVMRGKRRG